MDLPGLRRRFAVETGKSRRREEKEVTYHSHSGRGQLPAEQPRFAGRPHGSGSCTRSWCRGGQNGHPKCASIVYGLF